MKRFGKLLAAAMCLSALADFAFAAGTKKVSAKEGIVVAEGEAQMYSDGFKLTTVTLLYRKKLDPSSVTVDDYYVAGHDIKSVSVDGKNVKISFDCDNRWYPAKGGEQEFNADVQFGKYATITQKGDVSVVGGGTVYTGPASVTTKKIAEPKIVRGFMEKVYRDDDTGMEIRYSIYMPLYYTSGWDYPVVIFMPDSRANTNISKSCLLQGEGGTVWASDAEQEKNKPIVIAIQYPKYVEDEYGPLVKEDGSWTVGLDVVYRAIRKELSNTRVNRNRIYAVGQGEGAVANFMIGEKYYDFYAAQIAISPMYKLKETEGLKREKLWVMVSSNDRQSCEAMDKAVDSWKKYGMDIDRATWNVDWSEKEFASAAKKLAAKNGEVKYTTIEGGGREYTWCIGNSIEEIRDWLMAQ